MHYRLLVTIALPTDWTSQQVRSEVYKRLARRKWFWRGGGRYGAPLCDWFVIGGRWTGLLAETVITKRYWKALYARFPELDQDCWPWSLIEEHADELDALWSKHGGIGPNPYRRSSFEDRGFADDAMVVTRKLYQKLLRGHAGTSYDPEAVLDLDNEVLGPGVIGRKWVVVIDYHS